MNTCLSPRVPLLALLLALGWYAAAVSAVEAPLQRRIVANLTQELAHQLDANKIKVLLVLPGEKVASSVTLHWDILSERLQRLEYIHSFSDFNSHWHKAHRAAMAPMPDHSRAQGNLQGPRRLRSLLQQFMGPVVDGPTSHHQQHLHKGSVALLTLGTDGAIRSSQSTLAAAIQRRMRGAIGLTLAHSTHKDKPETLVAFDTDGQPASVAVQESSVFRDAFTAIYGKKLWGAEGGGSGVGSTLDYTASVRQQLLDVLSRYNISSMLDSSCGSMHWMPLVLQQHEKTQPDFKFMGTDVVCNLISKHTVNFAAHKNWNFQCVDYSAQPLPSGYQLVWSRDSLQHIPLHGTWQFLNNVRASGAKYLLVGSYVKSAEPNKDIKGGDYYPIDLLKPPFSVSKPLEVIDERTPDGKHLLLFDVANMTWQDPLYSLV